MDDSNICQHSHIKQGQTLVYNGPSPTSDYTHTNWSLNSFRHIQTKTFAITERHFGELLFLLCLCTLPTLTWEHVTLIYHGRNGVTCRMKLLWAQRIMSWLHLHIHLQTLLLLQVWYCMKWLVNERTVTKNSYITVLLNLPWYKITIFSSLITWKMVGWP
jgi:hypothetical protein